MWRLPQRLALVTLLALLPAGFARADGGYQLGRGWAVPDTPVMLGGYASLGLYKPEAQSWDVDLRHVSAFVWIPGNGQFSFFSETDLEHGARLDENGISSQDAYLDLERLYADWTPGDAFKLRVGKFLTPIGRWNLIHADPLVWTSSRPLVTRYAFPTNATGAMVYGSLNSLGHGLDYSVYGSMDRSLRPNPSEDTFKEAYGAHLSYPLTDELQLGLSYANFEQVREVGDRKNLIGFDATWEHGGGELSLEGIWRTTNDPAGTGEEKGVFVQGVLPLQHRFFLVTRYEYYDAGGGADNNLYLLGVDYRWSRALILKSEYLKAEHDSALVPSGFQTSIAVLF